MCYRLKKTQDEIGGLSLEQISDWFVWLAKNDPERREDRKHGQLIATLGNGLFKDAKFTTEGCTWTPQFPTLETLLNPPPELTLERKLERAFRNL